MDEKKMYSRYRWTNLKYVIYFYFNRFGRRKSLFISFLAASLGAIGALLMTDKAEHDNGEKYSTITQS